MRRPWRVKQIKASEVCSKSSKKNYESLKKSFRGPETMFPHFLDHHRRNFRRYRKGSSRHWAPCHSGSQRRHSVPSTQIGPWKIILFWLLEWKSLLRQSVKSSKTAKNSKKRQFLDIENRIFTGKSRFLAFQKLINTQKSPKKHFSKHSFYFKTSK